MGGNITNKFRRNNISKAVGILTSAKSMLENANEIVNDCSNEEHDYIDSIPENLQSGERYDTIERNADLIDDACGYIDDAISALNEAIG